MIKSLLDADELSDLKKEVNELNKKLDLILSVIVVQQKDACEAAGITSAAVRQRVLRGDVEVMQRDGSRLNFLTLSEVGGLKPRRKRRK